MTDFRIPGAQIEEKAARPYSINGAPTTPAGFISVTGRGPLLGPLTSFADLVQAASPNRSANLSLAVRGFFENGGQRCFVAQIAATDPFQPALEELPDEVSIICCPDEALIENAAAKIAAHCEERKDRICVLQSGQPVVSSHTHVPPVQSSYAAYYHPWIVVRSVDGSSTVPIPPCGHIAGVYARVEIAHGVWAAPANIALSAVSALSQDFTDEDSANLNSRGINVIRNLPGRGATVGARAPPVAGKQIGMI